MSKVVRFGANFKAPMTIKEGIKEIERLRRQIDRLDLLPQRKGAPPLDAEEAAIMKALLDRSEAAIRKLLRPDVELETT